MIFNQIRNKSWEFRRQGNRQPEQHLACQGTQRGWRQTSFWLYPFLATLLVVVMAGCAPSSSALVLMPVTGVSSPGDPGSSNEAGAAVEAAPNAPLSNAPLEVHEYALVEQSKDNPSHLAFQQHVPAAIATQRSGWSFGRDGNGLAEYNRALQPFGFHLEASSSAPFSGYTLYRHDSPVQGAIARIWPVSLQQAGGSTDFLLPFVTVTGEKMAASASGVQPWPGQAPMEDPNAAPYLHGQLAYAQTRDGRVSVYAGPSLLYDAPEPAAVNAAAEQDARSLITWTDPSAEDASQQHWGLQLNGSAVIDGQNLNQAAGYDEIFGLRVIDDQPLYFFTRGGMTQVHYGGSDLPYRYDQIVHGNTGELAVFNPGAAGRVVWFYALRDGLWYYVEIGKFQ